MKRLLIILVLLLATNGPDTARMCFEQGDPADHLTDAQLEALDGCLDTFEWDYIPAP